MNRRSRVLIVDDDPGSREALAASLANEPVETVFAENGPAAMEEMDRRPPDLVLMDVMMPGMDGFELCRRVKAERRWRAIPIILVTALHSPEHLVAGLDAGADEFVHKPARGAELRARVRSMLRLKARHDELADTLRLRERMAEMFLRPMRRTAGVVREHGEALWSRIGRPEPFGEAEFRRIEAIGAEARQLENALTGLLLLARMDAGRLVLDRKPVDPNAILTKAQEKFSALAFQREVGLLRNLEEPAPSLSLDAEMFRCGVEIFIAEALAASAPMQRVELFAEYPAGTPRAARIEIRMDAPPPRGLRDRLLADVDALAPGRSHADFAPAFGRMIMEAHGGRVEIAPVPGGGAAIAIALERDPTAGAVGEPVGAPPAGTP